MSVSPAPRLVRFGVFEFDLTTGDLFNGRRAIRLQEQPRQVLSSLVSRPGELVTREELRALLWPGDTFVDFDTGLNVIVNKIRQALDDSATSPRFIETLPRRGYRFVAPVARIGNGDAAADESRTRRGAAMRGGPAVWLAIGKRRFPLEAGDSIIGRDPGATVHLDDASVSRRHARIVVAPDGATLEDLDSKNGTFLGETRVRTAVPLSDRDAIRIGSVPLVVRVFSSPASTVTGVEEKP